MNMLSLFLPFLLMVHNAVDFSHNGACEEYVHILNCIVNDYVEMLEENNNIHLVNKVGSMNGQIHFLGLHFESYDLMDQDTARKMMLQLVDSFLNKINSNKRLKNFLCPAPFTADQLEIRVNFVSDCLYPYPEPGMIKYMTFIDGKTTFYAENPRWLGNLEKLREETLEFSRLAENLPYPSVGLKFFTAPAPQRNPLDRFR